MNNNFNTQTLPFRGETKKTTPNSWYDEYKNEPKIEIKPPSTPSDDELFEALIKAYNK